MTAEFPFFIKIKGVDEISGMLGSVKSKVEAMGKSMQRLGQDLTLKVTAPLAALGGVAIREAGKIEQLQVSLESMLGSADLAKDTVKQLTDFTAKTPFQLAGVGGAAKQLLSAGVSTDELRGRLTQLADVASGVGADITEIAKPYAKALQKGKASLEELYPIAERGAPILQVLADKFGTTKDVILKAASAGEITSDIFVEAFKEMTTEGNVFYQASAKQSQTIFGLFSTLKDNVSLALADFGNEIVRSLDVRKLIADLTEGIQGLVKWFNSLPAPVKEFAIKLGLVAALIGPAITSFGFLALGISGAIGLFTQLSGIIGGITLTGLTAGFTAALPVIAAIAAGAVLIMTFWKPIAAFFGGFFDGLKEGFNDVGIEFGFIAQIFIQFGKLVKEIFGLFGITGDDALSFFKNLGHFLGFVIGKLLKIVGIFSGILGLINIDVPGFVGEPAIANTRNQNLTLDRDRVSFSNTAINSIPGQVEVTFSNVPQGTQINQTEGSVLKKVNVGHALPGV